MFKKLLTICSGVLLSACQSGPSFDKTAQHVDIPRFMGKWYVIAGRTTFFEKGAHNAIEYYTYNSETGVIDVNFQFNKGALDGKLKTMTQSATVFNKDTGAHWKISLWWLPYSPDYLVLDVDPDYQWTAIGVPSQNYLWIMARQPVMNEATFERIMTKLKKSGYRVDEVKKIRHNSAEKASE